MPEYDPLSAYFVQKEVLFPELPFFNGNQF